MSEKATLARPYAKAVFLYAKEHQQLDAWSTFLTGLAALHKDARVLAYLSNPLHSREQLVKFLIDMLDARADQGVQNFLWLLVTSKRLNISAEVSEQFQALREANEKVLHVEVVSFAPNISQKQHEQLAQLLGTKFDRNVSITSRQDTTLLGGVVVHAGNTVIDGSVREKLEKLRACLKS